MSVSAASPPLPELRQDVVLVLPNLARYGARVTRVTPEEVVLVLMLDARDPLHPGDVAPMSIEYPGPRGLVCLEGRGTVATHDLVRFHLEGAVDVVQRRDFVRVQVVRPLALAPIQPDGSVGEWVESLTVNVSGNGLLAAGPETLSVDDEVCFRIDVGGGEPAIEGRGRVVRLADAGGRAIGIEELGREARQRLIRFVFERERIARQRTRDGEL
ncbi:MAG: PilZ domain-containing protein [Conexibacter sp.]